jgi:hypothetical protein
MEPTVTPTPALSRRGDLEIPRRLAQLPGTLPTPVEGIWATLNLAQQRNVLDVLVRVCCLLAHPAHSGAIEQEANHDAD